MSGSLSTFDAGSADRWPLAVVFDCDGVLLDTASCWQAAYRRTLQQRGRSLRDGELAELDGASIGIAARHLAVPTDELAAALERAFGSMRIRTLPGVRALLDLLVGRVPLAVATNAPKQLVATALATTGIAHYFDAVLSAETSRDKPAPDVYLAACRALDVRPQDCAALEDSPLGVDAARRAGLTVVYVPSRPGAQADADLEVAELTDPRLYKLLGLPTRAEADHR